MVEYSRPRFGVLDSAQTAFDEVLIVLVACEIVVCRFGVAYCESAGYNFGNSMVDIFSIYSDVDESSGDSFPSRNTE